MYIKIYQIEKTEDEDYDLYVIMKQLKKAREKCPLDSSLYALAYEGSLDYACPDNMIRTFNRTPPPDYFGRPLCVGDVVQVESCRHPASYYFIELFGYIKVCFDADDTKADPALEETRQSTAKEPEFSLTATMKFVFEEDDIDCLVGTILDNDAHWYHRADITSSRLLGGTIEEQIARGGTIRFYLYNDKHYDLTIKNLLNGLRLWLETGPDFGATNGGHLDIWDIDKDGTDQILQYALFGKIEFI